MPKTFDIEKKFIIGDISSPMKYKYCPNCKKAYVKSRLEKEKCIYCNEECETVEVKRNGLYYIGYGIMVLGAVSAIVPRVIVVSGGNFFLITGIGLLLGGMIFVMMGSVRMAQAAVNNATGDKKDN